MRTWPSRRPTVIADHRRRPPAIELLKRGGLATRRGCQQVLVCDLACHLKVYSHLANPCDSQRPKELSVERRGPALQLFAAHRSLLLGRRGGRQAATSALFALGEKQQPGQCCRPGRGSPSFARAAEMRPRPATMSHEHAAELALIDVLPRPGRSSAVALRRQRSREEVTAARAAIGQSFADRCPGWSQTWSGTHAAGFCRHETLMMVRESSGLLRPGRTRLSVETQD